MYYEESIIDGVLHWRGMPAGNWTQFTLAELTQRIENLKDALRKLDASPRATEQGAG